MHSRYLPPTRHGTTDCTRTIARETEDGYYACGGRVRGCGGLFFFSSRRRHTRWPRDWSSDVCSSDLGARLDAHEEGDAQTGAAEVGAAEAGAAHVGAVEVGAAQARAVEAGDLQVGSLQRSEERRVGKEGGAPALRGPAQKRVEDARTQ